MNSGARSHRNRGISLWLAWLTGVVAVSNFAIVRAQVVQVTPQGYEFLALSQTLPLLFGGLFFLWSVLLAVRWRKEHWLVPVICMASLAGGAYFAKMHVKEIEFRRTPPCWGMHSIDPGSGEGCPDGMRPDFTLEELRAYYRRNSKSEKNSGRL